MLIFARIHIRVIAAAILLCFARSDVWAGVIRHDRSIHPYNQLALRPEFASAGYIFHPSVGFWHTGTLVAPNKVLTCAHAFDPDGTGQITRPTDQLLFGFDPTPLQGTTYQVVDVLLHPMWPNRPAEHDLALLVLDKPVLDVIPAKLAAVNPLNQTAVSVGYGIQADGYGNELGEGQQRLAYENVINYIGPDDGKLRDFLQLPDEIEIGVTLRADFDSPFEQHNSYGSPSPLDLEGASETGDSGGPLFVNHNGEWYVAGVLFGGFNPYQEIGYGTINLWSPLFSQENHAFLSDHGIEVLSRLHAEVPEPLTVTMIVSGACSLLLLRHRRKQPRQPQE